MAMPETTHLHPFQMVPCSARLVLLVALFASSFSSSETSSCHPPPATIARRGGEGSRWSPCMMLQLRGGRTDTFGEDIVLEDDEERKQLGLSSSACAYCCARPTKAAGVMQRCGWCKVTRYCSTACQKAHWPDHRSACPPKGTSSELPEDEIQLVMDYGRRVNPPSPLPSPAPQPLTPFCCFIRVQMGQDHFRRIRGFAEGF